MLLHDFLRLKLYVVFLLAKVTEKIADWLSFEKIIVCYLSFLLYIMILWFSFCNELYLRLKISSFAPNSS
ncbi:hypothetical protein GAZ38_05670 [Bacteroides xylanisolvens]|uniref:Uncharacterized protein n=1 Tax=Bacteroides xylanisolvens TaxID=371601 RepID=A0A7J5QNQ9_9BACE|nr:hypothetical protein GAZ46_16700 [Bacteroides xylanisolvens]KAB6374112.1 hypothetical protein GAZ38_05670 [Bacteroides xylanisolvens]KAB6379117.1 hypothetical protein GAZ34_12345 [Bacteroides xylanisolvens]KAB6394877.1 hypothetical protein GAZ29_15100 [Bacteroides xylanisolvens]KAB6396755.1 hypothetical protein GAZ23_01215 [Bacteroides xylanisolvens]